ncbi:MAG: MBL fold metallo-hydrolase [Verrucomicrobia bacterium RIFCSPLOWO2_12_FULL_64_8]|nr:MAG: MBL fold metallo-hydrolase [Verrucomicrobia bacterium RIFCSPLOWO2_12_FULL_64_8]
MNRRTFLVRSAGLAAAGLFTRSLLRAQSTSGTPPSAALSRPQAGPPITEFKPLRRNTGIFTGRGGTIGWLAAPAAFVVVDTQFPDTAGICLAGLPDRAGRTLDAVINTHHHRDHTAGNPVFKPATKTIVAQANAPKLQFAAAEKAGGVDKEVFADTTFDSVWRRDFGGEVVTAQYFGPAHTGGDAIVHFEKANVIHMGDLVFNRMYPVIDRPGGASVRGWITVLGEVHKNYPADAIYVFGHGNPKFGITGTRDDLGVMRDYFVALLGHVQRGITAGRSKAEIVALDNLPGFPDFHAPPPNRLQGNLGTAYDELTAGR